MKIEKLDVLYSDDYSMIDMADVKEKINEIIDAYTESERNRSEQMALYAIEVTDLLARLKKLESEDKSKEEIEDEYYLKRSKKFAEDMGRKINALVESYISDKEKDHEQR